MHDLLFAPTPITTLPIAGTALRFPVRRVFCVGRNYDAHRREMGATDRDPPFFFSKPADAVVPPGRDVHYPPLTQELHHEVELVVALREGGHDISVETALDHVFGYAVGVDLTRRDLQNAAKSKGHPWEAGKAFDESAPMSAVHPAHGMGAPNGAMTLSVNRVVRQQARLSDMIWNVAEVIHQASRLWRLAPGDVIFTGTPQGVGSLIVGDYITCEIEGVGSLAFSILPG
jgi:fumarylpyruvate hydrolase